MDINRSTLDTMFVGFKQNFMNGFEQVPDTWKKFAMAIPSSTNASAYPFLEQFGGMREWIGERHLQNVSSRKIEVVNRDFEETVSIPRNDMEDDQIGIYGSLISQLGYNAGKLWQDLAVDALLSNPAWIDSFNFFVTSGRTYGGQSIVNASSSALSAAAYAAARQTMMEYKGHNGRSLGVIPNLLIVGPKNEATAFSILKDRIQLQALTSGSVSGVGSAGNPWNGTAELLVLPELSGAHEDVWFLAATTGVLRPVVVQQRRQPVLTSLDRENDSNVFFRKEYVYGADARGEAFLAFPHLIYKGGMA